MARQGEQWNGETIKVQSEERVEGNESGVGPGWRRQKMLRYRFAAYVSTRRKQCCDRAFPAPSSRRRLDFTP